MHHLYSTATKVVIPENCWYYFYSEHIQYGDKQIIRINPTRNVSLYAGKGLLCPNEKDAPILLASPNKFSKVNLNLNDKLGLQIYGIHASEESEVIVSVEGNNPNIADLSEWVIITSIFFASCMILLLMYFLHAVFSRKKVHYQVDLQ